MKCSDLKPKIPENLPPGHFFIVSFASVTHSYRHMNVVLYKEKTDWFSRLLAAICNRSASVKIGTETALARIGSTYDEHKQAVENAMRKLCERHNDTNLRTTHLYGRHP